MTMRGRKVTLRPVEPNEAVLIVAWTRALAEDPEAAAASVGNSTASISDVEEGLATPGRDLLMILAPTGEPVGLLEWQWLGGARVRVADIGITVGVPELWNLGYGADAFDAVIEHLFLQENAHRIQFCVNQSNLRMLSTIARPGGPVLEGIRREASYIDGCYEDLLLYGILRSEFDDFLPLAPDLQERTSLRRELQRQGSDLLRQHLDGTLDSAVHHLLSPASREPLAHPRQGGTP